MSAVDVVIPCFNYGHFLGRCVNSVLSQDAVDVRVMVIDDCSTDDSAAVAGRIADSDARVTLVRHDVNKGHIATYNEGLLDWADRDLVVLLSADDLLAPGALRRAARIMEADPNVGMVYGRAPYFERHTDLPPARAADRGATKWSGAEWIEGRCRSGYNVISSPEVVLRTSVQHEVGGYEAALPHVGDLEMWLRVAAVSDVAYVRGATQAFYRVHSASMQRTIFSAHLDDLRQRRDGFDFFFERSGSRLDRSAYLHDLARRALAREALSRACRAYDRDALDEVPVGELVDFALSTSPAASGTAEYRGLQRRRRLGPTRCRRTQLFVLSGIRHRLASQYRYQRWKRRGV